MLRGAPAGHPGRHGDAVRVCVSLKPAVVGRPSVSWFSDRSLRTQWRFAQAVLALPVFGAAITAVVFVGLLLFRTGDALALARAFTAWDLAKLLVPAALCAWGIERIERHLAKPAAPAQMASA